MKRLNVQNISLNSVDFSTLETKTKFEQTGYACGFAPYMRGNSSYKSTSKTEKYIICDGQTQSEIIELLKTTKRPQQLWLSEDFIRLNLQYVDNLIAENPDISILTYNTVYDNPNIKGIAIDSQKDFENASLAVSNIEKIIFHSDKDIAHIVSEAEAILKILLKENLHSEKTSISFHWNTTPDFMSEIAKIRAFRILWSAVLHKYFQDIRPFEIDIEPKFPQKSKGLELYRHIFTTNAIAIWSDVNILSSLNANNSKVEVYANSQIQFQTIDPWGGSDYLEYLTNKTAKNNWEKYGEL